MNTLIHPVTVQGYTFTGTTVFLIGTFLLWIVLVLLTLFWPRSRRGWTLDVLTGMATVALAMGWQMMFYSAPKPKVTTQIAAGCALIATGARDTDVRARLGAPTRIVPEEETRGPGAAAWVYDNDRARCAVHMMLNSVEYTE